MANIDGEIVWQANDNTWFTTNAAVVYPTGLTIYHVDGRYKFTDGVTALSALSFLGGGTTPTFQEVTDAGNTTTNGITVGSQIDVDDGSGASLILSPYDIQLVDIAQTGYLFKADVVNDIVKYKDVEVSTVNDVALKLNLSGGSLTGALNEAKGANIASAATTDIGAATGNLIHITGSTTITSFGTVQAGTKRNLVFDATPIITNSANIILPNSLNIQTAVNDTAIFISEGGGVWRLFSYKIADDGWITYSPTLTGFSVNPTGFTGKYKLIGKTCFVQVYNPSGNGTSNATTTTVTLPFNAKSFGVCSFLFCINNTSTAGFATGTTSAGSNVVDIFFNTNTAWTASGGKRINGSFTFEIQ